jgi:heat shock protein HslJ
MIKVPLLTMALSLGWMGMAMSADLAGGHWRPSSISLERLAPETPVYVAFSDDGKVTGFGGCNRFFGGYTVSGNSIKIGPLASTRKGCPDTLNLEIEFFKALQGAETFEQTDAALVLIGPDGAKLAELVHTDNT